MAPPQKQPGAWDVVSTAPATAAPDGWNVVSTAPTPPVQQPSLLERVFGAHPISDTGSVVGKHLQNMIAGPYHAFTDPPQNSLEQQEKGTNPNSGVIANGLGQFGLGVSRMILNPTINQGSQAIQEARAGHYNSAANHAASAVPIAGPMADALIADAKEHGIAPALAGLATDFAGPKVAGKVVTSAARGAGLGASLTAATDASRNLAASRVLLKGSPGELLQSALKPGVKYGANVDASLTEALPHVIAADPALSGVSGFAAASDKARNAAHAPFQTLLNKTQDMPVSSQSIADAARNSVSRAHQIENPLTGAIEAADTHARIYDDQIAIKPGATPLTVTPHLNIGDLNEVRSTKNAQLQNLFADTPADRASVLKANPNAARMKAIRDEAADTQYGAMSGLTSVPQLEIQGMQDKYGLLRDVSDIANKREPVFARHDPVSLSTKIVSGHGNPLSAAWNYMLQSKLGDLTNSDAQVNSAVDRFQNPTGTPLIPRPGIVPKLAMPIGTALRKTPNIPLLLNPLFLGKNSGGN